MSKHVYTRTVKTNDGVHFQVRWRERIDGKTIVKSKNFSNILESRQFAHQVRVRLGVIKMTESAMDDLMPHEGHLDLLIPEYVAGIKARSKSSSMASRDAAYFLNRLSKHFGWKTTADITRQHIVQIVEYFQGKRTSAFQATNHAKRFLKWCEPLGYKVPENYLTVRAKAPQSKETFFWTDDHVRKIFKELENATITDVNSIKEPYRQNRFKNAARTILQKTYDEFILIMRLMLLWAARPIEASNLQVRDWDSTNRRLSITAENAKNGRQRYLPIDAETAFMLDELCKNRSATDFIFLNHHGKKWTTNNMSIVMRNLLRKIRVPGTLYCARHYATSQLLRKSGLANFRIIMKITGHETLSEFQKYIHVYDNELRMLADGDYADAINTHDVKRIENRVGDTEPPKLVDASAFEEIDDDDADTSASAVKA